MLARGAANIADQLFGWHTHGRGGGVLAQLHCSLGYGEPEIHRTSIRQFGSTSADAGQHRQQTMSAPACRFRRCLPRGSATRSRTRSRRPNARPPSYACRAAGNPEASSYLGRVLARPATQMRSPNPKLYTFLTTNQHHLRRSSLNAISDKESCRK